LAEKVLALLQHMQHEIEVAPVETRKKSDDLATAVVLVWTSFPASAGAEDLHSLRSSLEGDRSYNGTSLREPLARRWGGWRCAET